MYQYELDESEVKCLKLSGLLGLLGSFIHKTNVAANKLVPFLWLEDRKSITAAQWDQRQLPSGEC